MKEDEVVLIEKVKKIIFEVARVLSSKLLAAIEVTSAFAAPSVDELVKTYASFVGASWLAANKYTVTFKVSDNECRILPVDRIITIEFNDNTLDNRVMLPIDKLANINTLDQHQTAVLRVAYILFLAVKEARHPELGPDYANVVLNHSKDAKVTEIKNMYAYPDSESEATRTDSAKAAEDATDSIIASAISGTATIDASELSSATEMTEAIERAMRSSASISSMPYTFDDCVAYTTTSLDSDTINELKKKISDLEDKMSVLNKYLS